MKNVSESRSSDCVRICADSIPLHLNISRRKYDPYPGDLHLKDILCELNGVIDVTRAVERHNHRQLFT